VNSFAGAPHHHATILLIWQIDLKPDLAGNDSANTTHIINYICLDNRERLRCDGIESLAAHRRARHHGSITNTAALGITKKYSRCVQREARAQGLQQNIFF